MSSPDTEPEYRTRRERIDPLMLAQGWQIVPFDPGVPWDRYTHHAVTEFEIASGPADYALFERPHDRRLPARGRGSRSDRSGNRD